MNSKQLEYPVLISTAILLVASLACQTVMGLVEEEPEPHNLEVPAPAEPDESPPSEVAPQEPPTSQAGACPTVTDNILRVATKPLDEEDIGEIEEEPEEHYLATYSVSGDQISDPYFEDVPAELASMQFDEEGHQRIWKYFITLIPLYARESVLVEFTIMTDGEENGLAAVAQTFHDPNVWGLEVDMADTADTLNLTYTLIHEFAHLLTLGPNQVTPSIPIFNNPDDDEIFYAEASACPVYFPGEGCSRTDSYINVFFDEFWADIHLNWQDINLIEDDDEYYEALDNFYFDYEDRFLTNYAVTNPEEDIAETFTFFVLSPRPAGNTIAEEKILFLYGYPELVQLRDEITTGICSLN